MVADTSHIPYISVCDSLPNNFLVPFSLSLSLSLLISWVFVEQIENKEKSNKIKG
jgi:hypothetical protein